jgi:hypothetical protein
VTIIAMTLLTFSRIHNSFYGDRWTAEGKVSKSYGTSFTVFILETGSVRQNKYTLQLQNTFKSSVSMGSVHSPRYTAVAWMTKET